MIVRKKVLGGRSAHGVKKVHNVRAKLRASRLSPSEKMDAFEKELENLETNKAFSRVKRNTVREGANIVGSHVDYLRKDDGSAKARIVPWGKQDSARHSLKCDIPCVHPEVFRLCLSIASEHQWDLRRMDAKAAFLKAKGFEREIFMRPPHEAH